MIQSFPEKPKWILARRAMTLVELLVVLAIVSALAALVLPAVKGMIADRKTSQTAIVVKNYLEGARARAIGKNRSVAVVLERLSGRADDSNLDGIIDMSDATNQNFPAPLSPRFSSATASFIPISSRKSFPLDTNFIPYNTCIKLSMAEEPLPVTEKSIPIIVQPTTPPNVLETTMRARSPGDGFTPTIPIPYDPVVPLVDPDQGAIAEVRIFQVSSPPGLNAAALLGEYLIAGNEVSFGESPTRFTITSPTTRASHDTYSNNNNPTTIWFSVMNEQGLDGLAEMAMHPYVNAIVGSMSTKFKIYQKPKPIYTQTIQLPKGTCIDLSLSGFANDRSATSGLSDYRVRFASDWVRTGSDGIPTPEELRPIYLVFSPDGSFSRVFANQKMGPQSVRIDSVEDVFLHVGRIDQVVMPLDPNNASAGRNVAGLTAAVASGTKMNLTDASSYVLRLSPKSGAITAAPISFFTPAAMDTLGDIIGKSRLATYNSTITGQ